MSQKLVGKVAIVTGASRGIGREIASWLSRDGATLACISTTIENSQSTVDHLVGKGHAYACDVSSTESVDAVFKCIEADLGVASILVNNAGITKDTLLMRMSESDFDRVIAVNLKGAFNCIKAASRGMMKARWGRIINVSSIVGLHGAAGQANYAASKAGLIGLTMAMAKELGARNITCNAVAPGFIETDMTSDLPEDMKQSVLDTAPLGRLGSPADIAAVVAFLASDDAAYITGQTITVDGGLTI